jgi:hypothetical protein
MPHHNDWWSAFDVIKPWQRQWKALTRALAELEDLRDEVLGCLTPEGTMPPAGGQGAAADRDGKIDLLLIRMESLDLDLGEVRRNAASTFCKLADSCVNCGCKERCERDLAYASAGMVTRNDPESNEGVAMAWNARLLIRQQMAPLGG